MELFKLLGTIAVDNQPAIKALEDTSKKAGVTSQETSDAFKKIGTVAGGIAKGIFTAGAALGGAWLAAIEGSREYRTEMGKLDTAFVTNGHSSAAAKQSMRQTILLLENKVEEDDVALKRMEYEVRRIEQAALYGNDN